MTVGVATTVAELKSTTRRDLAQLQVERARFFGFDIQNYSLELDEAELAGLGRVNRRDRRRRSVVSDLVDPLHKQYLNFNVYSSLLMVAAAAEAIKCTIVVWVAHPTDRSALRVHRVQASHGGSLAIHSPRGVAGIIHLRFYKSGDETNANVYAWGAGFGGHFEVIREPLNGWPVGDADPFTPRRGPDHTKRGAKGPPGPDGLTGHGGRRMKDSRTNVSSAPKAEAAKVAAEAEAAKVEAAKAEAEAATAEAAKAEAVAKVEAATAKAAGQADADLAKRQKAKATRAKVGTLGRMVADVADT